MMSSLWPPEVVVYTFSVLAARLGLGRMDNLGSHFPNMKVIYEYLAHLDPLLWGLAAKIYLRRILNFKVAQGQIQ